MKDDMNELRDIALAKKAADEKAAEERRQLELRREDEFSKKVDAFIETAIKSFKKKCADLPYAERYYLDMQYPSVGYDDRPRFINELNSCFKKRGVLIECNDQYSMDGYSDNSVQCKLNLF